MRRIYFLTAALAGFLPLASHAAPQESVLYSFTGVGRVGVSPFAGVVADANGALYGTTVSGYGTTKWGTVFQLVPPAIPGGSWSEETLHIFRNGEDGGSPEAALAIDAAGNLYGTTYEGGGSHTPACLAISSAGCGTVFKLTPPRAGQNSWTYTVLHRFTGGSDGGGLNGPLIVDGSGNVYGTTLFGGLPGLCEGLDLGCGTIFRLVPSGDCPTGYRLETVYRFKSQIDGSGSLGPLYIDADGAIYGTDYSGGDQSCPNGCGTVYKLTPPAKGTLWQKTDIHDFSGGIWASHPESGVVADANGTLYGTTYDGGGSVNCFGGCGTVYQLVPPPAGQTLWAFDVLYAFQGNPAGDGAQAYGNVVIGTGGTLYGTTNEGGGGGCGTYGCGTVFALTPPSIVGAPWRETILHTFIQFTTDGLSPQGQLLISASGALYGATRGGGDLACPQDHGGGGCGTVFQVIP